MGSYRGRSWHRLISKFVKAIAAMLLIGSIYLQVWHCAIIAVLFLFVDYLSNCCIGKSKERYDLSRGISSQSGATWVAPLFLFLEIVIVSFLIFDAKGVNFGLNMGLPRTGPQIITGDFTVGESRGASSSVDPRDKSIHLKVGDIHSKQEALRKTIEERQNEENIASQHHLGHHNHVPSSGGVRFPALNKAVEEDEDIPATSRALIGSVLGPGLPISSHPELRRRTLEEVKSQLKKVFEELPSNGFDSGYKNPCWLVPGHVDGRNWDEESHFGGEAHHQRRIKAVKLKPHPQPHPHVRDGGRGLLRAAEGADHLHSHPHFPIPSQNHDNKHLSEHKPLACLPYAYILGMPKCGTSDLFSRLAKHPQIAAPEKKEVRWFTRGEFTWTGIHREEGQGDMEGMEEERRLGPASSIYSFAEFFRKASETIREKPLDTITIDGGPHTFWWGIQNSNGHLEEEDTPIPQIIRMMQPNAKFILTVADPVRRLYSDYYFLDDNLKVMTSNLKLKERHEMLTHRMNEVNKKESPQHRQERWHKWNLEMDIMHSKIVALEEKGEDAADLRSDLEKSRRDFRREEEEYHHLERDFNSVTQEVKRNREATLEKGLPQPTEKSAKQFHSRAEEQVEIMRKCVIQGMHLERHHYTTPGKSGGVDPAVWGKYIPVPGGPDDPLGGDWNDVEKMDAWWNFMTHLIARGPDADGSFDHYDATMALLNEDKADYWHLPLGQETPTTTGSRRDDSLLLQSFFRASQICAHDRYRLARGGWGRLSLGLYALHYEKWLEIFPPASFHWARLEHYDGNERAQLASMFAFLGISGPDSHSGGRPGENDAAVALMKEDTVNAFWQPILHGNSVNVNHRAREPMWKKTEEMLRKFYLPYNILMTQFLARPTRGQGQGASGVEGLGGPEAYLYSKMTLTKPHSISSASGDSSIGGDSGDEGNDSMMTAFEEKVATEKKKRAAALKLLESRQGNRHKRRRSVFAEDGEGSHNGQQQEIEASHNRHGHLADLHDSSGRQPEWPAEPQKEERGPSLPRPSIGRLRGNAAEKERVEDDQEEPEARRAAAKKQPKGPPHAPKPHFGEADWTKPVVVVPHLFDHTGLPQRKTAAERKLNSETEGGSSGDAAAYFDTWLANERHIDTAVWARHIKLQHMRNSGNGDHKGALSSESEPYFDESDGYSQGEALEQLCAASFAQDIAALKYLLWDVGIPADTRHMNSLSSDGIGSSTKVRKAISLAEAIAEWMDGGDKQKNKKRTEGSGGDDDVEQSSSTFEDSSSPLAMAKKHELLKYYIPMYEKADSNAWTCLSLIRLMGDAHSKSHVFSALKGRPSWLTPYLRPPNYAHEDKDEGLLQGLVGKGGKKHYQWKLYEDTAKTFDVTHSVLQRDLFAALAESTRNVSQWLVAAGTTPRTVDQNGNTPLIQAANGGMDELTAILIRELRSSADIYQEKGDSGKVKSESMKILTGAMFYLDINYKNKWERTALHYAVANGHTKAAKLLLDAGADLDIADKHGVTARSMLMTPGSISPEEALGLFGVKQRPARQIPRVLHPGNATNRVLTDGRGWSPGTGGWREHRLENYETDMSCDIDQYWADELNPQELYHKYVAHMKPVLIRGLIKPEHWKAIKKYSVESLKNPKGLGQTRVQVSDIPYASKFGGAPRLDMTLTEYVEEVISKTMPGGRHPWYVFKGHTVPDGTEGKDSLVHYEDTPTPPLIHEVYKSLSLSNGAHRVIPNNVTPRDMKSRELFINAQWAMGGAGTGAPVHYHNSAWNMLVYGAKKWFLYSPRNSIMSNKQILDFTESDMLEMAARGKVRVKNEQTGAQNGAQAQYIVRDFNRLEQNYSVAPMVCVQTAGDVMIVPEAWGHGVLNIQDSVAVATESKSSMWRANGADVLKFIPSDFDNRRMRPVKN